MTDRVQLWRFPVSHYCDYVEFLLRVKGIPHDVVKRSPTAYKEAERQTGKDRWPFLVTPEGPVVWEDAAAWCEKTQPTPALDPGEDGRRVENYVLHSVGHATRRLFYRGALRDASVVARAYKGGAMRRFRVQRVFLPIVARRYGATDWHESDDVLHLDAVFTEKTPVATPRQGAPRTSLDVAIATMLAPILVVPEWERRWGETPLWKWAVAENKALRALPRVTA